MAAGLYTWRTFRFDVFHVNPPLLRLLATAPVTFCSPICDWRPYSSFPGARREWLLGTAFLEANDLDAVRWYFFLARCMCIPICLVGAYFCHRLAKDLYGNAPGLCALILWCFSPSLLAGGATICPDVAAAAMGIVVLDLFRRWLHEPGWKRAAILGLMLGLAELTKFTLLFLYPVGFVGWLCYRVSREHSGPSWRCQRELVQLMAAAVFSLVVISAVYGFDGSFRRLGDYRFQSRLFGGVVDHSGTMKAPANRFVGTWLEALPLPLPADMVQGIDTQRHDFEQGMPSYLGGQWADHGWWYYYLYALALKEPLGVWCLAAIAIATTQLVHACPTWRRDDAFILVLFVSFVACVSSQTGFSSHFRYVVPALPYLYVWISKAAMWAEPYVGPCSVNSRVGVIDAAHLRRRLAPTIATATALLWVVAASLMVYPHSMAYFNELAILPTVADTTYPMPQSGARRTAGILATIQQIITAGPRNGPRHLLGSSIDWGQDLFHLKKWLREHPDVKLHGLAYDGFYPNACTDLLPARARNDGRTSSRNGATDQPCFRPGWYALSVNQLYGRDLKYRDFLRFEPVAMAGYSIYIYHLGAVDDNGAEDGAELLR